MNDVVLLIVGKSGSGKTTITEYLKNTYKLKPLYSYTDRPQRYEGEIGHTFVTRQEFDKISKDNMVAYTEFDGYRYCATSEQINNSDLYIIDKKGIDYLKERYISQKNIKTIYIQVSWYRRLYRMLKRGDSIYAAVKRLIHDFVAFKNIKVDCTILNEKVSLNSLCVSIMAYRNICIKRGLR